MKSLLKLNVPWSGELHDSLCESIELLRDLPNLPDRKFSIHKIHECLPNAVPLIDRFGLGLSSLRNFALPSNVAKAVGLHKDYDNVPSFALNVLLTGSAVVNIHAEKNAYLMWKQGGPGGVVYRSHLPPEESLVLHAGEVFLLDIESIHSIDTLEGESVVLSSFVPNPQFAFSEAVNILTGAGLV
jgi:hypothetical protein